MQHFQGITNSFFWVEIGPVSLVDWLSLNSAVKRGLCVKKVCLFKILLYFYKNVQEIWFYDNNIAELPKAIYKCMFNGNTIEQSSPFF